MKTLLRLWRNLLEEAASLLLSAPSPSRPSAPAALSLGVLRPEIASYRFSPLRVARKALAVALSASLLVTGWPIAVPVAHAAVPQLLNYQGKLGDTSGNPLTGVFSFRFKFYSQETGGSPIFTEDVTGAANAVPVVNGLYSIQVGSVTVGGIPANVFDGTPIFLEIDVNSGTTLTGAETLSPRERVTGSPFAVHSLTTEKMGVGVAIATFTSTGILQLPYGVTAGTAAFTGSLTASTFTATGIDSTGFSLRLSSGLFTANGTIQAALFQGNGAHLTGITASNIPANISVSTINATATTPYGGVNITTTVFLSDGNARLGIGTTNPVSAKLQVVGGDIMVDDNMWYRVGGKLALSGDATSTFLDTGGTGHTIFLRNGSTERMRINSAGLGLGTLANAGALLHVSSASAVATSTVLLLSTGTAAGQQVLAVKGDGRVQLSQPGTAASPALNWSLAGTADPDTGFFEPAADILGFATGGAERARVSATGLTMAADRNISLSGPQGFITLASSVTASAFFGYGGNLTGIVAGSVNASGVIPGTFQNGVYTFVNDVILPGPGIWNAAGNVGIGTTAPGGGIALDVTGTVRVGGTTGVQLSGTDIYTASTNSFVRIRGSQAGTAQSSLILYGHLSTPPSHFELLGGTADSDAAVGVSRITGASAFASATTNTNGGTVRIHGGSPVAGGLAGNVIIAHNGTNSLGMVGVGTSAPAAGLHVSSNGVVAAGTVFLVSTGTAAGQQVLAVRGNGTVEISTAGSPGAPAINWGLNGTADSDTGLFQPQTNAVAIAAGGAERLRITDTQPLTLNVAGTAALPALNWGGPALADGNMGVYRAAADQLGIATNGAVRVTVADTAVTLSAGESLLMSGSAGFITTGSSVNASAFFGSGLGLTGVTASVIPASGVTPGTFQNGLYTYQSNLEFTGGYGSVNSAGSALRIGAGGTSPNAVSMSFGNNTGWRYHIGTNVASTFTPRLTVVDQGAVGIGTTNPDNTLDVSGTVDATAGYHTNGLLALSNTGGILQLANSVSLTQQSFYTGGTERLRIDSAGNVGIAVTNPGAPLAIAQEASYSFPNPGAAARGAINIRATTSNRETGITFSQAGVSDAQAGLYVHQDGAAGTHMYLATTNNYSTGPQARITIRNDGKIGVGTTGPANTLHVVGPAAAQDFAVVGDNLASTSGSLYNGGVFGQGGASGYGVFGKGPAGGVFGKAEGAAVGVFGETDGGTSSFFGVLGQSTGTIAGSGGVIGVGYPGGGLGANGPAIGVYGQTIRDVGNTGIRTGVRGAANDGSGTATAEDFDFYAETANGRSYFAGSVGIGTTIPQNKLHVSNGGVVYAQVQNTVGTPAGLRILTPTRDWYLINGAGGTPAGSLTFYDATAVAPRALFTTAGDLGIGTTNPQARLDAQDTDGGLALRISTSATAGHASLSVNASGLVGIGTTNVGELLDVAGDIRMRHSRTRTMTITASATAGNAVDIGTFQLAGGNGGILRVRLIIGPSFPVQKEYVLPVSYGQTNNTWQVALPISQSFYAPPSNAEYALDINVNGATALLRLRTVNSPGAQTAYVVIEQDGLNTDTFTQTFGSGAVTAPTVVFTGSPITQVGLANLTGKVGIGTSSPIHYVHVTTANALGLVIDDGQLSGGITTNSFQGLGLEYYTGSGEGAIKASYPTGVGQLTFWTTTGGVVSERMMIEPAGDVGIGINNPTAQLHVFGNGGSNIDLIVNGRLRSGDAGNSGGMWVDGGSNQFFGQLNTTMMGLYNAGWHLNVTNGGLVGIGHTNPLYQLHTIGQMWTNNNFAGGAGAWSYSTASASTNYGHVALVSGGSSNNYGFYGQASGTGAFGIYNASGTKSWANPHPKDPTKSIVYATLEGGENGTYWRGRGSVSAGKASVKLPEHFTLASSSKFDITVTVTPRSADSRGLAVTKSSTEGFEVRELAGGRGDYEFDFVVMGKRRGYEEWQPIQGVVDYVPFYGNMNLMPEDWSSQDYYDRHAPGMRAMFVENGLLNPDGSINRATFARHGWRLFDRRDKPRPQPHSNEPNVASNEAETAAAPDYSIFR